MDSQDGFPSVLVEHEVEQALNDGPSGYRLLTSLAPACYEMNHKRLGHALIISNSFSWSTKLARNGTEHDVTVLRDQLEQLGFRVEVRKNLSASEMKQEMMEFSQRPGHRDSDCSFCAIFSHGCDDHILSNDHEGVKFSELIEYFKADRCESLRGKPKIFLVQACRNQIKPADSDAVADDSYEAPFYHADADMLIHYATAPGQFAFRNPKAGSYFVQSFCRKLGRYSRHRKNFLDVLTEVNAEVMNHLIAIECEQMPQVAHQLTKHLFLAEKSVDLQPAPHAVARYETGNSQNRHALIIVNSFDGSAATENDARLLRSALKRFGFQVHVSRDLNAVEMKEALSRFLSEAGQQQSNCFLCAIISRGSHDFIQGSDNRPVKFSVLTKVVKDHSSMRGKPKIFMVQVCEADETDGPASNRFCRYNPEADMLIHYVTVPKQNAVENLSVGGEPASFYTRSLCEKFQECSMDHHKSFLDLLTEMNNKMVTEYQLMPQVVHQLTKSLFLATESPIDQNQLGNGWDGKWCDLGWKVPNGNVLELFSLKYFGLGRNHCFRDNVWLGDDDHLHLKMRWLPNRNEWSCATVYSAPYLGYGTLHWFVNGSIDGLAKNIVFSLGTFNGAENEQGLLYCSGTEKGGNTHTYVKAGGPNTFRQVSTVPLDMDATTHRIIWSPHSVIFEVLRGHTNDVYCDQNGLLSTHALKSVNGIPNSCMRIIMRLDHLEASPPAAGTEPEIVLRSFKFTPYCQSIPSAQF